MPEPIRVLIADDHEVVRRGLRSFLATEPEIAVVAEAADGEAAVRLAEAHRPDVVLMDLVMPGLDGVEATRRILAVSPESRVIVLTSYPDDERVVPAIRAGALSYLLKDVAPDQLIAAIRAAKRGEPVLHPVAATRLMQEMHRPSSAPELTPREREVLALVAKGLSNQEIAARLYIAERTVKSHISSLLAKLGLEDRTQLAIYAIRNRLVEE
ncbi:MAG: response regulator transcription factor [Firmicutes bacterium]|nr:response regulator transcription factor [Bacillota bacterium]